MVLMFKISFKSKNRNKLDVPGLQIKFWTLFKSPKHANVIFSWFNRSTWLGKLQQTQEGFKVDVHLILSERVHVSASSVCVGKNCQLFRIYSGLRSSDNFYQVKKKDIMYLGSLKPLLISNF